MKVVVVLLALASMCQAKEGPVVVRYGDPSVYLPCRPGEECFDIICYWFENNKDSPLGYIDYSRNPYLSLEGGFKNEVFSFALSQNRPCQIYDMCQICGTYGECVVERGGYTTPECECEDGYTGDYCDKKDDDDDDTTVIIIIVVVVVLIILIVVIILLCCCCGGCCGDDCGDCGSDCYGHGDGPRRRRRTFKRYFHRRGPPQVVPQPVPIVQPIQGNIGFNPVPHQDPITPTLQVSEIRENGQINGLNTFVIKNQTQNLTSYVTHPRGPTVITNMPTTDGTGFGANSAAAVFT